MPREMLDQDAGEALHRAADGAVDHHRRLLLAVGVDVAGVEALRQVEVHLRRAALPVAADGVAQHVLEFRPVEGALAGIDRGLDPPRRLLLDLRQHPRHDGFRMVPQGVGADALLGARGELHQDLVEAEIGVGREDQVVDLQALGGELVLGAEDVRVVLGEAAHAHQAVHGPRRLVAVDHAELGHAQGQVAVRLQAVLEDLHVAGAVHRLQGEPALVLGLLAGGLGGEHVLAVPAPVAGGLPQRLVEDLRRVHLGVVAFQAAAHVGDQLLEDRPALGVPEHDAGPLLLEVEEVHLLAQAPVVAALGLLQPVQVGVEISLRRPGRAVDARQHRVVGVAPPIGAGDLHQLEGGADLARRGHVRAAAEVEPLALAVDLQILARGDRVHQLDLVALALVGEELLDVVARPDFLRERGIARDDLAHLRLDLREVLGRERLVLGEVVVEAVLDDGADRHLGAGPERLHRLRQHVGAVVADQFERPRVVAREELDRSVVLDDVVEVAHRAVERHGDRALGERLGDALHHGPTGHRGVVRAGVAVGEGQDGHDGTVFFGSNAPRRGRRVFGRRGGEVNADVTFEPAWLLAASTTDPFRPPRRPSC
ncbi:hypothetical protein CHKEEEPN_2036 [Methylorubrum podarium]|nr:hypothetical protein CHKEEEPN_2036 [Methylorubrum podarium]